VTEKSLDLKDPALLQNINIQLGTQISGHERSRLLAFTVAASCKTPYPVALILVGDPGAGKSRICEVVMANFEDKEKIVITSASAKALDYLPEESLANKVLYVGEVGGIKDAGLGLRTLLSEGRLARLVTEKDPKTGKYVAELVYHKGKPVFLSTTNLVKFSGAMANRILFDSVDQSSDQIKGALAWKADQASKPHFDEAQPDQYLTGFLKKSVGNRQVLVSFLGPIAEKLPSTKTLIFRRYDQLEYLVKVSSLIHYEQRIHVEYGLTEYVVAHPVDFLYARDLLGPGGITSRTDQRLTQVYDWMKLGESYRTLDVARGFNKSQDWARIILDELNNLGLAEKNENTRPYFFTKLEANPETDPLQPEYLEDYNYDGPLFEAWYERYEGTIKSITYRPDKEPFYVNPVTVDPIGIVKTPFEYQTRPIQPESGGVEPTRLSSVSNQPQQLADDTERVHGMSCTRCKITYPDRPSFDNHLSTYKHNQ